MGPLQVLVIFMFHGTDISMPFSVPNTVIVILREKTYILAQIFTLISYNKAFFLFVKTNKQTKKDLSSELENTLFQKQW